MKSIRFSTFTFHLSFQQATMASNRSLFCRLAKKWVWPAIVIGLLVAMIPAAALALQAAFTANPQQGATPLMVTFTDQSLPTTYTEY